MIRLNSATAGLLFIVLSILPAIPCHGRTAGHKPCSISIIAPHELPANPVAQIAIDDTLRLLRKGFPRSRVSLNDYSAAVRIILPPVDSSRPARPSPFSKGRNYGMLPYPDHDYRWRSAGQGGVTVLRLETQSAQGISFALYGLLQEKLGYRFYHPRGTIIPKHLSWPLAKRFTWKAVPRYEKRGFHLHTLHPTELTEQLHDPTRPHALDDVKEYIDWLARNQQNVMQFYLLRNIDRDRWPDHARRIVDYAHSRGILIGVNFSLSMLQQQAFQAIHLLRPVSYRRQIDENMAWLFRAGWDFATLELTMGEHLPDLGRLLPATTAYLVEQVTEQYGTKVFISTHVIGRGKESGETIKGKYLSSGILIHTVMCWSVTEADAPVYGNRNQRFMLDRALQENRLRETWYWPESSYWVTFDNPVPLLLLPYLDARLADMNTMAKAGIPGHLTFSSGWEWGYWLIDWSIARWSWDYSGNTAAVKAGPLGMIHQLFPDPRMTSLWSDALELQNVYFKKRGLLPYMAALPPFAELPPPFNKPFQPVPDLSYSRIRQSTDGKAAAKLEQTLINLDEYAKKMEEVATGLDLLTGQLYGKSADRDLRELSDELTGSLRISAWRAKHRALTLRALSAGADKKGKGTTGKRLLQEAYFVRQKALSLVRRQESRYRYPAGLLAERRKSRTAYEFGYLYPVNTLFFWEREEEQVRRGRFDALFMNIWDYRRVLGLDGLFF